MKIRNKKTGEVKEINPKDAKKYGLNTKKAYGGYMQMGGITDTEMGYGGYLPMAQAGIGISKPTLSQIIERYRESESVPMETIIPSMLTPVMMEDQGQPFSTIQRSLPEGIDYSSQVPFNTGVVQVGNIPVQVPMKQQTTSKNLGLVDYLASMNMASDKESRKKLAKDLGIKDYDFSAAKNTELLKLLKSNDKINKKVTKYQQYTFPESLSSDVMTTPQSFSKQPFPPQYKEVAGFPGDEYSPYSQPPKQLPVKKAYEPKKVGLISGWRDAPIIIAPKKVGQYVETPYMAEGGINNPGFRALPEYVQEKIKANMAVGGCMECGGKMQAGGKTFEDIQRERAAIEKQIIASRKNPYVPSSIIEYPAIHTDVPLPKQKAEPKIVYPPYQPKKYIPLPPSRIQDRNIEYVYAEGGKMPQWLAEVRFKAAGKEDELGDYGYLDEAGDGKWIQKATASIKRRGTEGVCTGSKFGSSSCPPGSKRYNLAKTFRKMAKSRKKEDGGYAEGGEYEMTDAQIAKLRAMGYKIKEV